MYYLKHLIIQKFTDVIINIYSGISFLVLEVQQGFVYVR